MNYGTRCGRLLTDMGYANLVYRDHRLFGSSECHKLLFSVSPVSDHVRKYTNFYNYIQLSIVTARWTTDKDGSVRAPALQMMLPRTSTNTMKYSCRKYAIIGQRSSHVVRAANRRNSLKRRRASSSASHD